MLLFFWLCQSLLLCTDFLAAQGRASVSSSLCGLLLPWLSAADAGLGHMRLVLCSTGVVAQWRVGSSWTRIEPVSPALAAQILITEPPGKCFPATPFLHAFPTHSTWQVSVPPQRLS